MNSSTIQAILLFIVAGILALWLGVSVATNQVDTVMKFSAGLLFVVCVFLGRKIWLLMLFFAALNVPLIRGFATVELGQVLFIGFSTVIFMLRRLPLKLKFGELELWMVLIALCVVQVYLRHPVGLNMFGAGAVGARPYFMITLSWSAGLLLAAFVVTPSELRWALKLSIVGSFVGIFLTGVRLRLFGGGEVAPSGIASSSEAGGARQTSSIGYLGLHVSRVVSSYISPLRACFHPLWAPLVLFSVAAAAGSGYRNIVAAVGLNYLVGIAYRGGFASLMVATLSGVLGLIALALLNLAMPLPANIQRALSPLPGTWEERHVRGAEESTEWRVEMWKEALFTPHWIDNKILGDGLGFSRREHQMMLSMQEGGEGFASLNSGLTLQQETMMVTGAYHSGPVQTVRTVGYVGLLILIVAMIRLAVHAHRQIVRCRGTEWYPLALFFSLPAIASPIFFVFVFGEYGPAAAGVFGTYGLVRLMEANLPLPAYVKPQRGHYILKPRHLAAMEAQRQPG
jgi:hypothetical protein